jgi:hypothetical protein
MAERTELERRVAELEAQVGGLALGLLLALGGLAVGRVAVGGGAVGAVAAGGGAAGYYACGGGAVGEHVVDAIRRDPEAMEFFRRNGLAGVCGPARGSAER